MDTPLCALPAPRRTYGIPPDRTYMVVDPTRLTGGFCPDRPKCGLTLEQIQNELLNGRDLSKKGSRKGQLEYVFWRWHDTGIGRAIAIALPRYSVVVAYDRQIGTQDRHCRALCAEGIK